MVVLLYEGNFRAALLTLDRLMQDQQSAFNKPAMLLNRSLALRGLGRYAESSADYQEFLRLKRTPKGDDIDYSGKPAIRQPRPSADAGPKPAPRNWRSLKE